MLGNAFFKFGLPSTLAWATFFIQLLHGLLFNSCMGNIFRIGDLCSRWATDLLFVHQVGHMLDKVENPWLRVWVCYVTLAFTAHAHTQKCLYPRRETPAENFPRDNVDIMLIFSGCWRYNANARSLNIYPFQTTKKMPNVTKTVAKKCASGLVD